MVIMLCKLSISFSEFLFYPSLKNTLILTHFFPTFLSFFYISLMPRPRSPFEMALYQFQVCKRIEDTHCIDSHLYSGVISEQLPCFMQGKCVRPVLKS